MTAGPEGMGGKKSTAGSAFGGTPGSHEDKALLLSHTQREEPSLKPLSPHAADQWRKTPESAVLEVPAGLSNREGPQPGLPLECLLG